MKSVLAIGLVLLFQSGIAHAAEPAKKNTKTPEPIPTAQMGTAVATPADEVQQNNRMRALEGSKSPWSIQLQLSYAGSSLVHPFSELAPNPANDTPPPVVKMSGLVQGRYRISKAQSVGFGAGLSAETPFQGIKNTSISDPYADYAYSITSGSYHNRTDFAAQIYTADDETKYGYSSGYSLSNDSLWSFGKTGLTVGLSAAIDYSTFGNSNAIAGDLKRYQQDYDFNFYPFAEYSITKRVNFRSVVGAQYTHTLDQADFTFHRKKIYETAGLGVSWTDDVFTYFFVKFYPSPLNQINSEDTSVGFSAIINMF